MTGMQNSSVISKLIASYNKLQTSVMEQVKYLMDCYGLTEKDCCKVVSDLHLDSISRSCCARGKWKTLAPHLEIERAVADDIDRKQVDDEEKRSQFFYDWKQMAGSGATYLKLVSALLKIRHRQDAEEVFKTLQATSSQPLSPASPQHSSNVLPQANQESLASSPTHPHSLHPHDSPKASPDYASTQPASSISDPSSLPADLRKDLEQQLRFNLREITAKYTLFVECIRTTIKQRGVSVGDLRSYLLSQSVFDYDDHDFKLFSEKKDELQKITEVDQVFDLLNTEYSSFLNYEIFMTLVERYNLNEGQEELKYPEHLRDYINKQNISEFLAINPALVKYTSASKEVFLKLDIKPTSKLAKVKELSEAIADKMKWNPSAVRILGINKGCVIVTLIIPASMADAIFIDSDMFSEADREDFMQLHVLWMKCNGYFYNFSDSDMEEVFEKNLVKSAARKIDDLTMCTKESQRRKGSTSSDVEWSDRSGKAAYGAAGARDVLIIVSEDVCGPDVVQRRPAIQLTEEWREKLANQGIAREHQSDDPTMIQTRHRLDKRNTITGVEMSIHGGERLTRERVLRQITTLMETCNKPGVILHYIGVGRRNTGDWCFEDGYITFRDLAHLYLQLLCGHVLTITADCSHSGSWVRECMTFLDEQGVKPCGHSARDKGILIKVFASCLSHQVPRQLAYSVYACKNDKNTGHVGYLKAWDTIELNSELANSQHARGMDFTRVRCGRDLIAEECLCLPEATWQTWSARKRIYIVTFMDGGKKAWHILLAEDNDEKFLRFLERTQGAERGSDTITFKEYGHILKSGRGEDAPEEAMQSFKQKFLLYLAA